MNSSVLTSALTAVDDVRTFVSLSEGEVDAVRQLLEKDSGAANEWARKVASFRNGRKYDYACAVVLLYGALERFVEDSLAEYVSSLAQGVERYADLPEKLQTSHFVATIEHLKRTKDARYDGVASSSQLVTAFSGCLQGEVPYDLIAESLLHHTANFRTSVVDEFFGRAGVDTASRRAVVSDVFSKYLETSGKVAPVDRPEAVLDLIGELVSRRNEASHGDISNTLAPSELVPYCDQVEAYCKGLASVLDDSLLTHLVRFHGVSHGTPIAVYNHNIVCIQSKGIVISPGALLAIKRVDGSWYSTNVRNVQINGVDVDATPENEDIPVGLLIDGRCRETYQIQSGVFERKIVVSLDLKHEWAEWVVI